MSLADVFARIATLKPTPADLLTESAQRAESAFTEARPFVVAARVREIRDEWDTDNWPDPYGPDPVVFGSAPRFKNPMD